MRRVGLQQVLYLVLLPIIMVAAGILGYFSWRSASRYALLNQQTIGQSTLVAVRQKVDRLENAIIEADNRVFALVDPSDPKAIEDTWPSQAKNISPSIRAVTVLDDELRRVAVHVRGTDEDKWRYWRTLKNHLLPRLHLDTLTPGRLKHAHEVVDGVAYLLAFQLIERDEFRYHVILHHDTGHILRHLVPDEINADEGNRLYNVVDEQSGQRVFGKSLDNSGVFVVGRRFPTTLYRWRLQAAPEQAPLLEEQGRARQVTDVAVIGVAFAVILFGVVAIVYAADRDRRFNALKAEFIANVSHELKTPLSVVRMFSEMLVTGRVRDADKERQYLEMIAHEAERLSMLIENVLDFAALESGKRAYRLKVLDLSEVVRRAAHSFRLRTEHQGVRLTVQGADTPFLARIDDQAVALALTNLLDNAAKYGNGSPIELHLEPKEGRVELSVRDFGPGIPAEDLRKVFERFYRSRGRETTRGSGIGLSLVKHIAEAHGGRAWARNAPDGGATVAFSIAMGKVAA